MNFRRRSAFTLIELLIVIGVVAILATITLLVLNPAEMLKQGRDAKRISEVASISDALNLAVAQNPNISLGAENVLYISLPDTSTTCASWAAFLPPLSAASGWQYRCATADNLRKADGSGWMPVNFSGLPTSPFSNLPVDPVNAAQQGLFYSYAMSAGKWEINVDMESSKYKWGGERDVEGSDSGNTIVLYEKGADLLVMPNEANWRIGYIDIPSESCFNTDNPFSSYESYNKWKITSSPSGNVAIVKMIYWDHNGSLDSGESVEMAMYNSGSPNYSKISESVIVDGRGVAGTWVSSTLVSPVGISATTTYILGVGTTDVSFSFYMPADSVGDCDGYPPAGSPDIYYTGANGLLNTTVPTITSATNHSGFVGIMFSL
ncbi:MAG: type II secretion system protein [Patescibacteria group bacterium]